MKQIMTTKTTYKKWLSKCVTKMCYQKSYHINGNSRVVTKREMVTRW